MKTPTINKLSLLLIIFLTVTTLAHAQSYYQEVTNSAPEAYYRLGESSGTTAVDETAMHNATYVNGPTLGVTGAMDPADTNTAVNFAATGRVDAPFLFDPSITSFTVEFWINNNAIGEPKGVISQTDGTGTGRSWVYLDNTGAGPGGFFVRSFLAGVDNGSGFGELSSGTWYHIALVVTDNGGNSDLQWYKDGVAFNNNTNVLIEAANGAMRIASFKDGTGVLNGVLDEVAFYNYALSGTTILDHYNARFNSLLPIPEPSTYAMLGVGLAALAWGGRKRFRKTA